MTKAKFFIPIAFGVFASIYAVAQQSNNLAKGNYLVVAAFSPNHEDYAKKLTKGLKKEGLNCEYGFEATRNYWYVYLNQYSDREECIKDLMKIRSDKKFNDAWVWSIKDKDEAVVKEIKVEDPVVVKEEPKDTVKKVVTEVIENPPAAPVFEPQTLKNTQVFLSLYDATNNNVIEGDVEVINTEKAKLITRVKGNNYLILPNPGTESGQITLISNTFGYKKEQLEINYKNTEADTIKPYVELVGNFYMINFGMTRITKGDISTLYNVYFYNDAAIMLPESKYQLNSLLELMQKNDKMKIRLHGHTNGGGSGPIVYMGPSKNFFSITSDVKRGSGSAKALSEARAETIKEWLIAQGIGSERIEVKGWGGGRMVYDKNSAFARKNIRVDVEVTDD